MEIMLTSSYVTQQSTEQLNKSQQICSIVERKETMHLLHFGVSCCMDQSETPGD